MNESKKFATFTLAAVMVVAAFVGGRLYTKNEYEGYLETMKAGYDADIAGMQLARENAINAYEADIDGCNRVITRLSNENETLQNQVDYYSAGYIEDHSDWQDCHTALSFIDLWLPDIYEIDTKAPVPIIYMKDGTVLSFDSNNCMIEIPMPQNPNLTYRDDIELSDTVKELYFGKEAKLYE